MTTRDFYSILGVDKSADAATIKRAYRKLAAKHHPDRAGGDKAAFQAIEEAYRVLGDAETRAQYDRGEWTARAGSDISPERARVLNELAKLTQHIIQSGMFGKLTTNLQELCKERRGNVKRERHRIQGIHKRLLNRRQAMKVAKGGDNAVLDVLDTLTASADRDLKQLQQELDTCDTILQILGGYSEEEEAYTESNSATTMLFMLEQFDSYRGVRGQKRP